MVSPDGRYMLVFNGEIYNFQSLKDSLQEWSFKSEGDSEVLLASLIKWGESALGKIEGIFSFAFYDLKKDSLLLVRAPCGVKPLYYTEKDNTLLFSSELKGIITGLNDPKLSFDSTSHFLHFNYVPSPYTLVEGVHKVKPGHLVRYADGNLTSERYFYPNKPTRKKVSASEMVDVIGGEVVSQLVSDRPLGVLLSGGLDSIIVLHHASSVNKIKTFSTGFEMSKGAESEYAKFNADAQIAKKTSDYYGCEHIDFTITLEMIRNELVEIIEKLDEPVCSPTQVSQFMLNRFVRQEGIVVALGGDGGDELWGGYSRHTAVLAAQYFQKLPTSAQKAISLVHSRGKKLSQPLKAGIHFDLTALDQTFVNKVCKKQSNPERSKEIIINRYNENVVKTLSPIESFMRVDRELWLADDALQRTDRSSMASGVEVRVPLLGIPVVNFADSIHAESKFDLFTTKKILRDAYKDHLPKHLFNQPKRGWMAPGAKWLRDEKIGEIVRSVLSDDYYDGLTEIFDWEYARKLLDSHIEMKEYHLSPVWNLFVLQIWAKSNGVTI